MHIPIKKDLEEAYKDEFFKGFTLRETLYLVLAIVTAAGITALLWKVTGLTPDICVYVGVPCAVPVLAVGFYHIQGLTIGAYVKEICYAKKTGLLLYDADELPDLTQQKRKDKKGGRKRHEKNIRGER